MQRRKKNVEMYLYMYVGMQADGENSKLGCFERCHQKI
jgi:hypothetical protein